MPNTPEDFLAVAHTLAMDNSEMACRSAINRAYYAAYHAADQFHAALPMPGMLPAIAVGVHDTLYHRLCHPTLAKDHPQRTRSVQVGYKARGLKPYRTKADYKLAETLGAGDRDHVLEQGARLLEFCKTTPTG